MLNPVGEHIERHFSALHAELRPHRPSQTASRIVTLSDSAIGLMLIQQSPVYLALLLARKGLEDHVLPDSTKATSCYLESLEERERSLLKKSVLETTSVAQWARLGFSPESAATTRARLITGLVDALSQDIRIVSGSSERAELARHLEKGALGFLCEAIPWSKWAGRWMESPSNIVEPPSLNITTTHTREILFSLLGVDPRFLGKLDHIYTHHRKELNHIRCFEKDGFAGITISEFPPAEHVVTAALLVVPRQTPQEKKRRERILSSTALIDPCTYPAILGPQKFFPEHMPIRLKVRDGLRAFVNTTEGGGASGELKLLLGGFQCDTVAALGHRTITKTSTLPCYAILMTDPKGGKVALPRALGRKIPPEDGAYATISLSDGWWRVIARRQDFSGVSVTLTACWGSQRVEFARVKIVVRKATQGNSLELYSVAAGEFAATDHSYFRRKEFRSIDLSKLSSAKNEPPVVRGEITRRMMTRHGKAPVPAAAVAAFGKTLVLSVKELPAEARECRIAALPWISQGRMILVAYIGESFSRAIFKEAFDMFAPREAGAQRKSRKLTEDQFSRVLHEIQRSALPESKTANYSGWLSKLE
jgi:hypothetical protein